MRTKKKKAPKIRSFLFSRTLRFPEAIDAVTHLISRKLSII